MARFVFKVFVVFCVCSVALFAAKAPEDKCYFPPYNKEARYCNDYYSSVHNEAQCKAKKLESGYDEWVTNLKGLIDSVEVEVYEYYGGYAASDEGQYDETNSINNITIDLSLYLPLALSFDTYKMDFENNGGIREATECNGKSCTTKGYDDKGMLIYEANCISGVNHGTQRFYDKSKGLIMELNYNQGKLDGKQKIPQSLNADNYTDAEFIINDVVVKNGKLNGKINLEGSISDDYVRGSHNNISGEFKDGKPISVIHIGNSWIAGMRGEMYSFKIPFDKNSVANGYGISLYHDPYLGGHGIGYNYKNKKLASFESIDINGSTESDEMPDITEIAIASDFEKVKEINILTSKNVVDIYKTNYAKINNDNTDIHVAPYYKSGNFNAKGKKTGKWVEKNFIRFNNYEIITTQTLESSYENDKLNGAQKEWLNGKLIKETMYENGKLNGTLKEWDNNGNLIKAEIYKNDNRVQIIR